MCMCVYLSLSLYIYIYIYVLCVFRCVCLCVSLMLVSTCVVLFLVISMFTHTPVLVDDVGDLHLARGLGEHVLALAGLDERLHLKESHAYHQYMLCYDMFNYSMLCYTILYYINTC